MGFLAAGTVIHGRYVVRAVLGEGGAAEAYRVEDRLRREEVALKRLRATDPRLTTSLREEFARLARLAHPGLPRVYDLGAHEGRLFYTAALIEGVALSDAPERARAALPGALRALAFLHRRGLRHGDFKPANVRARPGDGAGVLLDLGCARPFGPPTEDHLSGTPGFLAPELRRGAPADARADLFAVGVSLQRLGLLPELAAELTREDPAARPAEVARVLEALGDRAPLVDAPSGAASVLVGRTAELRELTSMLADLHAARRAPRLWQVTGPHGIGKSRLLRELKWRAQLEASAIEGASSAVRPIRELLGAATGEPLGDGVDALVTAVEALAAGPARLLLLDDADRLGDAAREALAQLARVLPADGRVAVVLGAESPLALPGARTLALEPLDREALAAWAGAALPRALIDEALRVTGGHPAHVESLLSRADGEVKRSDLEAPPEPSTRARTDALPAGLRRALGVVAAAGGPLAPERAAALGAPAAAVDTLLARGWLAASPEGHVLARPSDAASILEALGAEATAIHRALAADAAPPDRARHLALAGDHAAAATLLAARDAGDEPRYAEAAELLARAPGSELDAAAVLVEAGRPDAALRALARALRARPTVDDEARLRTLAATAYLRLGHPARALRQLVRAPADAAHDDLRARALRQLGRYAEAVDTAKAALARPAVSGADAARLHEALGVAATLAGDSSLAEPHLAAAATADRPPRDRARIESYRAIAALRAGDLERAAASAGTALAIADAHGLSDVAASACSNLGSAEQQRGDWGAALEAYERGLRLALALGKRSSELALRFNLANLRAAVGLIGRARDGLEDVRQRAQERGATYFIGAASLVSAELAILDGDAAAAFNELARAREAFGSIGASRDLDEVGLLEVEAHLVAGSHAAAADALAALAPPEAADVAARRGLVEGRAALAAGDLAAAEERLAWAEAHEAALPAARAEAAMWRAEAAEARGEPDRASAHRARAREAWERIGRSLPEPLRDAFRRHPGRRRLYPAPAAVDAPTVTGLPARALRWFLEVTRRLGGERDPRAVLDHAMDAALALTAAERGFVLLAETPTGPFMVAGARHVSRRALSGDHDGAFSRQIAERVVREERPVISADALADARFAASVSVHAMQLRSILCLPIRAHDEVLGALYLDHRFEADRFAHVDLELLRAFADQVAIALDGARMVEALRRRAAELEARTNELAQEQARVAQLMAAQEAEIDRLESALEARQQTLELRYDYASILGRSAPMRRLLARVDRVVDTSASVLVRGESGTGKELVARAIHFNGPRREGAFVAVSCAAMPEALLEAELFGAVKGAFTGADADRQGLVRRAEGGTLFLDEIGEMPLATQAKLLRVLQERRVRPVGGGVEVPVDFRLVAATHRDLAAEVRARRFREDLYFRLAVLELEVPPLRERVEDIPVLTRAFLDRLAEADGRPRPTVARDVVPLLSRHPWPGNVRELSNVLTRAYVFSGGARVSASDVELVRPPPRRVASRSEYEADERERILRALNANRWNVRATGRQLGIPSNTLYRKLKRYGIQRPG